MINKRFTLSILALSILLLIVLFITIERNTEHTESVTEYTGVPARDLYVELPEVTHELIEIRRVDCAYQDVLITYKEMKLTYLGTYFITAYCPAECGGSWSTASGETCHRADWNYRLSEPTTCAIDRSIHSFLDEFYIPDFDRTFIAEDTGSGVRGRHLDLFYEEYEDVVSFPTGYYEVYSVEWEDVTVPVSEEELKHLQDRSATEYFWELN